MCHLEIDECVLDTDDCHTMANCTNTVGSFLCTCIDGYEGPGNACTGMYTFMSDVKCAYPVEISLKI